MTTKHQHKKPNFIFIVADDLGYADLGCYGGRDANFGKVSPNIDRLAEAGIKFTQGYSNSPVCSPTRFAMLSGRYQYYFRGAAEEPLGSKTRESHTLGFPVNHATLPSMLKESGYKSALMGKWHLGYKTEMRPNAQGFDYSFGHMVGCIDNYSHYFYWNGPNKHDLYRNGKEVFYPGQYFPDLMVKEAGEFMEKSQQSPFFMYFAINMPHYPYQGDPKWLEYYNKKGVPYPRNLYAAFMTSLDDKIGDLLQKVNALGLTNNTIIIFQSDNGYSTEERAHFGGGSAGVYRGAKASLFEGGIRVPSIISWPGKVPKGQVRNQFAVNTDWFPTLAEYCNIKLPRNDLDGKSLVSIINSAAAETMHPEGYCWEFKKMWVARKGKWKLMGNPVDTSNKGTLTDADILFLVDLEADPSESTNVATSHPDIVNELKTQYQNWGKTNKNK